MNRVKMVACIALLLGVSVSLFGQELGWPRTRTAQSNKLVYYEPQVDDWKNFTDLDFRMAVQLYQGGSKAPSVGVVVIHGVTNVDTFNHQVTVANMAITNAYFPALDPVAAASAGQLVQTFWPQNYAFTISLDRLVSMSKRPAPKVASGIQNTPPNIFVSYGPSLLLQTEGSVYKSAIPDTKLEVVINTNWPLFFDKDGSKYYLLTEKQWVVSTSLDGPWAAVAKLPKDFEKIAKDPKWTDLKKSIPPPAGSANLTVPQIFYASSPTEVIVFNGSPTYQPIPGTELSYATNANAPVFIYTPTSTYYYLVAGRWFSATNLPGPWTYATASLPGDFAKIPADSPVASVLASVPGTPEAEDAVLLAQIPTTAIVNPTTAAQNVNVTYSGSPNFAPITGTSLSYATNTADKVIQVGTSYYLCSNGIWFVSSTAQGPWQTANSVPQQIYSIPPSSPVYNVTYVTQAPTSDGNIQASYTAGYLGAFAIGAGVGAIIATGTGYYYPPYYGAGWGYGGYYAYPATYGCGSYYNPYTGAYGAARGVYGPYGGATGYASYNPYTGTYARGATAYGPYGSRSAGAAYNPYTGTSARGQSVSTAYGSAGRAGAYNPYTGSYAGTRQASNAYGNYGSSVVGNGNNWAATQHATTANGSYGSMETSAGGKAVAGSNAYGNAAAGKTANGNMYAGANGNVYKNTGDGWQKYDNGSWNSVNTQQAHQEAQQRAQSSGASGWDSNLQSEAQNRQRGASSEQSWGQRSSGWGSGSGWGNGGGASRSESGGGSRWGGGGGGRWGGWGGGSHSFGGGGWGGGGRSFGGGRR
jgi:hypothetical protein